MDRILLPLMLIFTAPAFASAPSGNAELWQHRSHLCGAIFQTCIGASGRGDRNAALPEVEKLRRLIFLLSAPRASPSLD